MRAERAVEGTAGRPARSTFPAILPGSTLLKSLVLAAAVGLAPAAFGQGADTPLIRFDPDSITVVTGGTADVKIYLNDSGVNRPVVPYPDQFASCQQGGGVLSGSFARSRGDIHPYTYHAPPDIDTVTRFECMATAFVPSDLRVETIRATLRVLVLPDETAPVLTFSPATLTVSSGTTAASMLTATDNVAVTNGPTVECDQGSFANNTYTAPVVSVDTTATCTATATDAAGNTGTATLTVSTIADTESPKLSFDPATLDGVTSGATVPVTLTATDNVDGEISPTVVCGRGSLDLDTNTYTAPVTLLDIPFTACIADAFDTAGNEGTATLAISIIGDNTPPVVTFSPDTLTVDSSGTGISQVSAIDAVDGTLVSAVSCTNGGSYNTGTGVFTAPTVVNNTTGVCTATAADAAGNEGTATLTVSIIVPDTTPPVVTFSPASITVTSGGTAAVTLAATDDVDGELVPVVTCTQGSFANDTYTAPDVSVDTGATCTATAADAAGNEGTATLTVSIIVPDTTPPVVTFTPATLTVASGGTASSTLTATDNVAVTEGPTVTCTQGSFDPDTNTYTALDVSVDTEVTCAATATDAAGNTGTATLTVTVTAPVAGPDITMSPVVSFSPDRIIVKSGAAIVSTLTATDDGGVTEGPIVTCTQGGSFEGNTYTAPDVTADTTDTCTATASDAGGNEGTATLTAVIIAPGDGPDRTPPVMTFSPATLIVGSRETARSTLTAADNVGIVFGGPGVTCNLGSFDRRTNTYTAPTFGGVPDTTVITCTAAAEDAAGNTGYATLRVLIKGRPIPADLTPPVVSFNPTALTVVSRTTGTLALTVTDNVGVADVKTGCLRGSFDPDTGTYTAFPYDGPVSDWCDVTAVDAAGNKTLARIRISIIVVDETPPVVFFNPESLTVDTGGTAPSTLISVDNVDGITEDLRVTCTRGSFRGRNTYIAPVVSEDTRAECRATAADAAGNQSLTAILRVFITAMDTTAPVPGFNPATLDDVASGATVFVTLTATDNVDRAITPTVTCMQGSFANNAYTAPVVSVDTADTCTATATDAAGNAGTATLTVSIVAPDITPPVLTFSPDTLTVISGTTASVTLTANDNEGITRGPMVSCFRGQGSFNIRDSTYTAPAVSTAIRVPCTARAFDAAGNRGVARFWVSVVPDRMRPELIFSPAALAVDSGATVAVTLTATDNVGITRGPVVTCTVGSFSIGDSTYTAPVVSVDTTATCTATAADAAGTEGTATLAVSVTAPGEGPDMTPPVLTFSPAALTVVSGGTASVAFAATDNVGIVRGPVVNCDHGSFSVMDNTYTAPAVREAIRAVCRARAFDAAGNRGRAKLTVFVISPDRKRPVLSFNPRTLSVGSGATASVTFTATDNVGIAGAPVVVCYPGSFNLEGSTFTYTAPVVSVDTGAGCKARARDAAGNRGAANLKVSITAPVEPVTPPEPPVTAPDETAPVVSFSPVSLTLVSGGTGLSRVTATDSDDNVLTPTVSCTNGGEYDVGTGVFTAPTVTNDTFSICTAMATDGDGNTGSAMLAVNITSPPVSCPDGFTESSGSPLSSGAGGGQTLCTGPLGNLSGFAGVLTESARIPYVEGVVYELSGRLDVGQAGPGTCTDDNDVDVTPVVLTIEAGVTIVGDSGADFMVVNRCHRIDASGTSEAPIVFTSRNDVAGTGARDGATGEWGGVVILGNAPINRCNVPGATGGTAACENTVAGVSSPDGVYGGGSSASDSGTLEYVTVRHAGAGLNAGLTLGGVGSGTTVNYIQVHNSSGDGIRVLGGEVDLEYLVLTDNADDQLDIDEGVEGDFTYVLGVQRGSDTSDDGVEVRSSASGAMPQTSAEILQFTLLAEDNTRGSSLRIAERADVSFEAGIVVDGSTCLDYETTAGDGVQGYTESVDPSFETMLFDCPNLVTTDTDNGDDPATGRTAARRSGGNNFEVSNTLDGFIPGPTERNIEPLRSEYVGAFGPDETDTDNWTTGWTRDLLPDPVCPEGTADAGFDMFGQNVCNVSGTVTDDLTLIRGNLYALSGRVDIGVDMGGVDMAAGGNAAALVIEPGVTVFGRNGMDHIVVNRGSTITAEGTEADPIIFTSVQDVTGAGGDRLNAAGEWGGLVILGRAPINFCNDPDATGGTAACERKEPGRGVDGLYGGAVGNDDSGSLRHVQVKYAGSRLVMQSDPGVSFNPGGITFGGVGSETDVEYVQVYNAPGRGIGYFGGTVNSRRVVVTGSAIQLDIDHGYRGSLQYVIGVQGAGVGRSVNVASARPGLSPASDPTIGNFTLIGADSTRGSAIRVRRNVVGTWLNGVVTGGNACLDYEDGAGDGVEGFTPGSDPAFRSVLFDCAGGVLTRRGGVTGQEAVDADRNNRIAPHTLEGFVNGPAEAAVPAAAVPRGNSFLEAVDYVGAVRDAEDTWWQGWTCGLGVEASDPC